MVVFLLQSLIKNAVGLGFVQPLGMVRGTSLGQEQPTVEPCTKAQMTMLFQLKQGQDSISLPSYCLNLESSAQG